MAHQYTTMVLGWIDVVNNVQPCRCSANGMRPWSDVVVLSGKQRKNFSLPNFVCSMTETVLEGLVKAERKGIEKTRKILTKIIDAVLYLARQGLAFRGHREYQGLGCPSTNEGNFWN